MSFVPSRLLGEPGSVERDASAFEDARGQPAVKALLEVSPTRGRAPRVQAPRLSKVPRLSRHPARGDVTEKQVPSNGRSTAVQRLLSKT